MTTPKFTPSRTKDTPSVYSATSLEQTTCPYCGVGCGVDVLRIADSQGIRLQDLKGMPDHPANFGRLCVKGTHLLDTNSTDGRLLFPTKHGERISWDEATAEIAAKIQDVIATHGPDAVAFYVSGQLLTEDYYVANKLMKGFIGSANIDTNSRLCMSSAVAAYKRAFGEDLVPCNYEDLELTDLIVLVGSNAAWTHPVLFQRMERARLKNPDLKVVVIDPRATDSANVADLHLNLKPGTDAILFNGLLNYLRQQKGLDRAFMRSATSGADAALNDAKVWTLKQVAEACDLPEARVAVFYQWFLQSPSAISFFSMGINQSTTGVDKGNAIINCHLASGKIGKPGSGPFSITGQPNAMGGREVGGLANMLAAHMDIDNPQHRDLVSSFWKAPNLATQGGLKAVDMFNAMEMGKIKFVWVMATNPVVSMPNRRQVEAALAKCEMVVVSDIVAKNDTLKFADIVLPATGWSEKDGTVTNSERRISRQRGILPPPGEARHDWQALCDVAVKMGFASAFNYTHPVHIFNEHAALTAFQNKGERVLNLSGLMDLTVKQYNLLKPVQWPVTKQHPNGQSRLFTDGQFPTHDGKAHFISVTPQLPEQLTSAEFPFVLNSGRLRDQWHTMTRTGKAAKLLNHTPAPQLSVHSDDARALGIENGDLMQVDAQCNSGNVVILPARIDDSQRKGEVFAPIHWSGTWGSHTTLGAMFNGAHDRISGQPELKHGAVKLSKATFPTRGLIAARDGQLLQDLTSSMDYWLSVPAEHCASLEVALKASVEQAIASTLNALGELGTVYSLYNADSLHAIVVQEDKLVLAVYLGTTQPNAPLEWLDTVFAEETLNSQDQAALLRCQPSDAFLLGKLVCTCFGVREKTIVDAIKAGENTVQGLGEKLKCGTNCGSCRTELSRLISVHSLQADDAPAIASPLPEEVKS